MCRGKEQRELSVCKNNKEKTQTKRIGKFTYNVTLWRCSLIVVTRNALVYSIYIVADIHISFIVGIEMQ